MHPLDRLADIGGGPQLQPHVNAADDEHTVLRFDFTGNIRNRT